MAKNKLVWMDLEFSGLDPNREVILEIASIITDSDLNIIEEAPVFAIHQSEEILKRMDDWNQKHHTESGLVKRVRESSETHATAEEKLLEFVKQHCEKNASPLCGNSIHMDRQFLHNHMPKLNGYLHYRNIDVSTIKELTKRWYPQVSSFPKVGKHLALDDIRESIEELKYLREKVFIP